MAVKNDRPRRKYIHFSYKEAKKLSSTQHSCVVEVLHEMSLSMSPKFVSNIRLGLKEKLGKELLTYNEELHGVPLAFDNIKVISSQIIDDQDLFKLVIKLSFVVFKPEPGKLLNAVVNKITDHHFGCVIHNCINGSVRQPNLDILTDSQKNIASNIAIGDTITFKVWKLDIHHGILFVLGDIVAQCYQRIRRNSQIFSDSETAVSDNKQDTSKHTKKKKKEKGLNLYEDTLNEKIGSERSIIIIKKEPDDKDGVPCVVGKSPEKKKTKLDSNSEDISEDNHTLQSPRKKKKKKESFINKSDILHDSTEQNSTKKEKIKKKTVSDSEDNMIQSPKKVKKKKENNDVGLSDSTEEIFQKKKARTTELLVHSEVITHGNHPIQSLKKNEKKKETLLNKSDIFHESSEEISPNKKKIKEEPLSEIEDSSQDDHKMQSPKKEKNKNEPLVNRHDILKDNLMEQSPKKKKTKTLLDSDHILQGNPMINSPKKKNKGKKQSLSDREDILEHNDLGKSSKNDMVTTKENFHSINNNNNKTDLLTSPSKRSLKKLKRKMEIKEECITDNDLFSSDNETALKRKKIKKTYGGCQREDK